MRAAVLAADERAIYRVHNQFFPMQTPLPGQSPLHLRMVTILMEMPCCLHVRSGIRMLFVFYFVWNVMWKRTDAAGRTPLEYAAANGYDDVVYLLINAGAKRIPQAMQLAETYGYKHVSGILRQFIQP